MVLNIIALVMILAITFINSIYGLFSGIINAVCAIVAAVVALGAFEVVDRLATGQLGVSPSFSTPIVIVVLFVVTLIILRSLADNLMRGNVRLPMQVDFAGGAVCGFIVAQICTGVLMIALQMLPLGGRVLMFQRLERSDVDDDRGHPQFDRNSIWLSPDGFTIGLVKMLSGGSVSSGTTIASVYPDFLRWVFWTSNTVQAESLTAPIRELSKNRDGVKNGISVITWWTESAPFDVRYRKELPTKDTPEPNFTRNEKYKAAAGMKIIGVRATLNETSADRDKHEPHHRFRPSQIRLVGVTTGKKPRDYACSILRNADDKLGKDVRRLVDIDNNFAKPGMGDIQIDFFFEVDEDFDPHFIEYRRFARAALDESQIAKAPPAGGPDAAVASTQEPSSGGGNTGTGVGRFNLASALTQSGEINDLPFHVDPAKARSSGDVEFAGEFLVKGRYWGERKRLEPDGPNAARVNKIRVPEGKRMCLVRFRVKEAQTLAGEVFNFVAARTNQYKAVDRNGEEYFLNGFFVTVKRNNEEYVEFFLEPEAEGGSRHMLELQHVEFGELTREGSDAEVGLVFVVPPGVTIVKIVNQTNNQGVEGLELKMSP